VPRNSRYITSPHVIVYWDDGDLVVQNYALATKARGTRAIGSIVHVCAEPRSIREIGELCPELAAETIRGIVTLLVARGVLYAADRPLPAAERAMARFAGWNPAAGFFHTATKNVTFDSSFDVTPGPTREAPAMAHARHYRSTGSALPLPQLAGQFPEVLRQRRTWRRFSRAAVSSSELSQLLWLTLAVQHRFQLADGTVARMRTSPSGGARHPIEACIAVRNVTGLDPGLYRYDSDTHRLHRFRNGRQRVTIERYLPGQPWYRGASFVVFFVARFARTRARYPYARAYRAVLIEAGHLSQTLCLTATWLNLAPFCTLAIADRQVEADLGLDGIEESVVFAAGVGRRLGPPETCMVPVGVDPPKMRKATEETQRKHGKLRA
jgi:SagB-type dehydrogenase family enzyme